MTGLPLKIQVPCLGGFHDVVLSRRGSLSFPAHKEGIKEIERMLNFEELGGEIKGGCHKVWLAWINHSNSLPEKLAAYRKEYENNRDAERILRTWQGPARRRWWGPATVADETILTMAKNREQYRREVLVTISKELRRRGHRTTWKRNASDPVGEPSIMVVEIFQLFKQGDFTVEAGWYPAGSVSLTVTIGRSGQVNVVRGKNEQKAIRHAVDLVERLIVAKYLEIYRQRVAPGVDQLREKLLRKASKLTESVGALFFRAEPAASLDSMALRGSVPGPLTDAAAKLALQWLAEVALRIDRLRDLSKDRMKNNL